MGVGTGVITGISVAYDHADLDEIQAACTGPPSEILASLLRRPSVSEAFALKTCNRFEAYVVCESNTSGRTSLDSILGEISDESIREFGHEASLRHLLGVACGMESLVLGEDQILGQLREAYLTAREAGGVGPVFEEALTKALHVGERARTETAINEGCVSLGRAAVELAARETDLSEATALVVGAGEMGTIAAQALAPEVEQLRLANRTVSHADHLAQSVDGAIDAVGLSEISTVLGNCDVVVSATASEQPIIDRSMLQGEMGGLLLIDIAQPRDIDPDVASLPALDLYDLGSLESITAQTHTTRETAAERVDEMIDQELERLLSQYKRKRADAVIATMYEEADRIKQREITTAVSQLEGSEDELTDEQREIIESLADTLVGQLLSAPTKSLRNAAERDDWSTINTALQLFDPQFDGDSPLDEDTLAPPQSVKAMLTDD